MIVTRRLVHRQAVVAACAAVVLAGCSFFGDAQQKPVTSVPSPVSSASKTSTSASVGTITPEKANSLIIPKDDVAELVGSALDYEGKASDPQSSTAEGKASCRALLVPLTTDIGSKWTTYRNVWYQEAKDTFDHLVIQRVLLYQAKDDARETYSKEFPATVRECTGEELKTDTATWRANVREVTEDRALWVLDHLADGQPSGSRCATEVRIIDNLLFSAMVCQQGNGVPTVKAIMDRMAAATKPK